MDWGDILKLGVAAVGILGALSAVWIFLFKQLFRQTGLLFGKYDALAKDVERIKLVLVSVDPSKTAVFNAFMGVEK